LPIRLSLTFIPVNYTTMNPEINNVLPNGHNQKHSHALVPPFYIDPVISASEDMVY
jgi:hypothetical protein